MKKAFAIASLIALIAGASLYWFTVAAPQRALKASMAAAAAAMTPPIYNSSLDLTNGLNDKDHFFFARQEGQKILTRLEKNGDFQSFKFMINKEAGIEVFALEKSKVRDNEDLSLLLYTDERLVASLSNPVKIATHTGFSAGDHGIKFHENGKDFWVKFCPNLDISIRNYNPYAEPYDPKEKEYLKYLIVVFSDAGVPNLVFGPERYERAIPAFEEVTLAAIPQSSIKSRELVEQIPADDPRLIVAPTKLKIVNNEYSPYVIDIEHLDPKSFDITVVTSP